MSRSRLPWVVVALALAATCILLSSPKGQAPASAEQALPDGGYALRMAVDPETGDLVPVHNAVDVKGPQGMNRSGQDLQQVVHPDGSVSMDLQGRFQCYATATVDAEGRVHLGYDHGAGSTQSQAAEEE